MTTLVIFGRVVKVEVLKKPALEHPYVLVVEKPDGTKERNNCKTLYEAWSKMRGLTEATAAWYGTSLVTLIDMRTERIIRQVHGFSVVKTRTRFRLF